MNEVSPTPSYHIISYHMMICVGGDRCYYMWWCGLDGWDVWKRVPHNSRPFSV